MIRIDTKRRVLKAAPLEAIYHPGRIDKPAKTTRTDCKGTWDETALMYWGGGERVISLIWWEAKNQTLFHKQSTIWQDRTLTVLLAEASLLYLSLILRQATANC